MPHAAKIERVSCQVVPPPAAGLETFHTISVSMRKHVDWTQQFPCGLGGKQTVKGYRNISVRDVFVLATSSVAASMTGMLGTAVGGNKGENRSMRRIGESFRVQSHFGSRPFD